jgi:prepilin-type N-terminal cleavage/methylation domain-containing protein
MRLPTFPNGLKAFSLAELMVSLAIIGVLAGLSAPTVLDNIDKAKRKAVFKETFNMMSNVLSTTSQNGELEDAVANQTVHQLFTRYLNPARTCQVVAMADNACIKNPETWVEDVLVLPNGAAVSIPTRAAFVYGNVEYAFSIDWNGVAGSNTHGTALPDRFHFGFAWLNLAPNAGAWCRGCEAGQVKLSANSATSPPELAAWDEVMK